jgi:hypothetical protein
LWGETGGEGSRVDDWPWWRAVFGSNSILG